MAAFLASQESPQAQPSADFVQRLRARLTPKPRRAWLDLRVSRRAMARGVAGGAAALAVCLFGEQGLRRLRGGEPVPAGWVPVARAAELPPGSVKRFIAGGLQGNVMNIGGRIWALSAICTHLPCPLDWEVQQQEFVCSCHPVHFDTSGRQTGIEDHKTPLPPLAKIPVQQLNGTIYVVATEQPAA
ncbi:MAG TPA: Rieske (2Fe-2S) protein [Chloroflexota bacterium]|nr:Rieske (2Fe-2S) protein [Chloroflexota bacterium]